MKNKNKKGRFNSHSVTIALLSFVLILIVGEIIVYVVQYLNSKIDADVYDVMLYVIPALSIVLTSGLIYLNHRTLGISNTLIRGLNKIAEGDYDVRIPYQKLDGFNRVYANFNKMAVELKSVKTLREDFVSELSHEFKTPIASINGFANLLLDGGLSEEERVRILTVIADESARLSRLSEGILTLSKIENQQFIGEKAPYALDVQLNDCIVMLERQWESKELNLSSDLEKVSYEGDASLLQQVWINLLSNAIKYTPCGGNISVSLKLEGGRPVVRVSDDGIGIAPDQQEKIFEKYYRVSGRKDGNGLGLAICKRICELCGGEISVASKECVGSTFTVKL